MIRPILFTLAFIVFVSEGCGSSGACGCCGCKAKAKARASKNLNGDVIDFDDRDDGNIFGLSVWNDTTIKITDKKFLQLTNPNHLFHRCCEERQLPSSCLHKCHFNVYNKAVLESMFFGTNECPLEFLPEIQFCAAQGQDHSTCCSRNTVDTTPAGEKCLSFCDQTPDVYTPIDYSYAPCLDRFEHMKRCFYDDVRAAASKHFKIRKAAQDGTILHA